MKTVDLSETTAACDLKIGRCGQLTEYMIMKICNYLQSTSFLDLGPRYFTYENKNLHFSGTAGPFSTKFCM